MSARVRQVIPSDEPTLREVLDAVLALTVKVDLLLAARARRSGPDDASAGALLLAISRYAADRTFSTGELLDACQFSEELQDAIAAALGEANAGNGRKLGKLLRRCEGIDHDGLRLERHADENGTARWSIGVSGV